MSFTTCRSVYGAEALEGRFLLSAGDLDQSFGVGGFVLPADQSHDYTIASVLVTPGGKTIVAGTRETQPGKHYEREMFLEEFNGDGSRDASFGDGGIVGLHMSGDVVMQKAVLQTDGKIIAVANTAGGVGVARFNSDGTLDDTFNQSGELQFDFGGKAAVANDAALSANGQLVVVGDVPSKSGQLDKPAIAQINADGSFDSTFAEGGELIFGSAAHYGVALRPDGRILLAGTNTSDAFAFAQLHSDGTVDTKFAEDGFGSYGLGHESFFERHKNPALTLLDDGDLLFTGTFDHGGAVRGVILRLTTKGKIDKTFGSGGQTIIKDNLVTIAASAKQIYVASADQTVYRLSMQGVLSPSFGNGGAMRAPAGGERSYEALSALTLDGGQITLGISSAVDDSISAVVRLTANADADQTFGTSGIVNLQAIGSQGNFTDITTTPNGKIIAVGSTNLAAGSTALIAEFNSDGTINTAFGNDGFVLEPTSDGESADSVVVDPASGKAYVAMNQGSVPVIVRLNADGSPDQTWGQNGFASITWLNGSPSSVTNLLLQSDGKLLAVGTATPSLNNPTQDTDFTIARFNGDGTLDTSFDQDGRVATSLGTGTGGNSLARALLQSDGKILLVGTRHQTTNTSDSDLALVRYNSDGSIDTAFGSGGKVFTNTTLENDQESGTFSAYDISEDAVILNNGQIVVADNVNDDSGLGLVLYNANGSLNQSYQNNLDVGNRLAVTGSGSIIALDAQSQNDSGVGRDTSQLTQDNSFKGQSFGIDGDALAIDGSGRILVGGSEGSVPVIIRLVGS